MSTGPGTLKVDDDMDFEGRRVHVLLIADDAHNNETRFLVDARTYLPVAILLAPGDRQPPIIRTDYTLQYQTRASLPSDFFDPRALGYVPQAEVWLGILDDPALGIPIFWPGRQLQQPPYQALLVGVEDRRTPSGKLGPGHILTIGYQGDAGTFRLDYWPPGKWEDLKSQFGSGFLWVKCSDHRTVALDSGDLVILRGFEPAGPLLTPPQRAGSPPQAQPDPFPTGCPNRDFDRFMAEIHLPGVTITVNAPLGTCCQDGAPFGIFDSEDALEAIASSLRARQYGE
jgi:hypothetical protein